MHVSSPTASGQTVLANGAVHPVPGGDAPASALAIDDGRIVYVGDVDGARSALPDARVVDLGGRAVLPAFIDSHTHYHRAALLRELYLDFEALRPSGVEDVLRSVRDRAASLPPRTWIQGDSISPARLAEGRLPDRRELDAAAPRHPVLIRGIGKHVVAANSAALHAAGIDRDTPDPPGGRIEHDAGGEPNGILHERAKLRLDSSATDTVVPRPSEQERASALRKGIAAMHALGVTTIHEMVRQPEEASDWAALHAADELRLRIRLYYRIHESPISLASIATLGIRSGLGDDWLRVAGVKISVDGWCIFRNAAVHEPYLGEPGGRGIMRIEPDALTGLVASADRAGLQVAVHAVGARAVDAALDAFAAARPWRSGPHRLEHAHLDVDGTRLARIHDLGLILSAQPGFLAPYLPDWKRSLEPGRVERIMPLASAIGMGIPLLINSDVPSGPAGPLATIAAAVTRRTDSGTVGAHEAIPLREAWRAHSTAPAAALGERHIGRLEAGFRADLIVLERDPFGDPSDPPDAIAATMVDGTVVHDPEGRLT